MNHHIHMQPSQHRAMLSWIFFGGCCMSMHDMATPLVRATWPHLQWQQQSAVKHLANETMIWYSSLEWPDVTYVFLLMKPMLFNCFISETTLLSFIFSLSLPILYVLSCVLLLILEIPSPCHHARTPMPCPMGPWPYIPFMYVCVCVWGRGGGRAGSSEAGPGEDIWIPMVWTAGMKALVPIGAPVSTVGARDVVSAWTSRRASGTP